MTCRDQQKGSLRKWSFLAGGISRTSKFSKFSYPKDPCFRSRTWNSYVGHTQAGSYSPNNKKKQETMFLPSRAIVASSKPLKSTFLTSLESYVQGASLRSPVWRLQTIVATSLTLRADLQRNSEESRSAMFAWNSQKPLLAMEHCNSHVLTSNVFLASEVCRNSAISIQALRLAQVHRICTILPILEPEMPVPIL